MEQQAKPRTGRSNLSHYLGSADCRPLATTIYHSLISSEACQRQARKQTYHGQSASFPVGHGPSAETPAGLALTPKGAICALYICRLLFQGSICGRASHPSKYRANYLSGASKCSFRRRLHSTPTLSLSDNHLLTVEDFGSRGRSYRKAWGLELIIMWTGF